MILQPINHSVTPTFYRRFISSLLALTAVVAAYAQPVATVSSADRKLVLEVNLQNAQPYYSVSYAGNTLLEPSRLGLVSSVGDFTAHLAAAGTTIRNVKDNYTLNRSKVSKVHYRAKELVCAFTNKEGDTVQVIFRVSNTDVAFRYRIPQNGRGSRACIIEKELTGFDFPVGTTTFITPQALPGTGWKKTKPSYEEAYRVEEAAGTASEYKQGYTFPALFHVKEKGWVLVSETGIAGDYPATHLSDAGVDALYTIAFPQSGENNAIGSATASGTLPMYTSWKTITAGSDLQPIVSSTVATDVVAPVVRTDKECKPGRASWSWIVWQDSSCNYKDQVTFIDLAEKLKCEYILIDAWWDKLIGRERMAELVQYARNKGVGVLLWYNSNGNWNETAQTPLNRINTSEVRKEEMRWLQQIGVKGLKVDFFGGDKQVTMQLYHDILTDAAQYGLIINFHGTTLPRGWERMYPNYVTSEAALTSENLVFQQAFCDKYAQLATLYPFTRNAVAAVDFGPVFLNARLNRNPRKGTVRKTTDAFEIATAVLFFSPVQHWGITPENLGEKPEYLFQFLREVPVVWDETKLIEGYPGKYCVIARRKGKRWFVAAVNGEEAPKTITLSLPELTGRQVTIISDGEKQASVSQTVKMPASYTVTIAPGGGAVLYNR